MHIYIIDLTSSLITVKSQNILLKAVIEKIKRIAIIEMIEESFI